MNLIRVTLFIILIAVSCCHIVIEIEPSELKEIANIVQSIAQRPNVENNDLIKHRVIYMAKNLIKNIVQMGCIMLTLVGANVITTH